jgi:hypothetical protein
LAVSFGFDLFLGAERGPKIEKHGAGNRQRDLCILPAVDTAQLSGLIA